MGEGRLGVTQADEYDYLYSDLTGAEIENLKRRRHKLARADAQEKNKQRAAFVEAAVVKAVQTSYTDKEFERAIQIVAHSVKEMLSPRALAYLEGITDDATRAGAVRWRELARLNLWLARASLPAGANAKKLVRSRGFGSGPQMRLNAAIRKPMQLFEVKSRVPGRIVAAIYRVAKRANVPPQTAIAAVLHFGLERLTQIIREAKEVPPTLTHEQLAAYPIAQERP